MWCSPSKLFVLMVKNGALSGRLMTLHPIAMDSGCPLLWGDGLSGRFILNYVDIN